ncbi:unnamed protein product [Fusarium graminearum]|nr:unnamed protein product [Fusarium graminearum]
MGKVPGKGSFAAGFSEDKARDGNREAESKQPAYSDKEHSWDRDSIQTFPTRHITRDALQEHFLVTVGCFTVSLQSISLHGAHYPSLPVLEWTLLGCSYVSQQ